MLNDKHIRQHAGYLIENFPNYRELEKIMTDELWDVMIAMYKQGFLDSTYQKKCGSDFTKDELMKLHTALRWVEMGTPDRVDILLMKKLASMIDRLEEKTIAYHIANQKLCCGNTWMHGENNSYQITCTNCGKVL